MEFETVNPKSLMLDDVIFMVNCEIQQIRKKYFA